MEKIDEFQLLLTNRFRELVLATAYLQIGEQSIIRMPAAFSVSLTLADGATSEPMALQELRPHSGSVGLGIAELFQTKVIAAWADLLVELFEYFVQMHLEGRKAFPALRKRTTKVGFSDAVDLVEQVRQGLVTDFAFQPYRDRIKIITSVLIPSASGNRALQTIKKHVSIRNSTQHHAGRVYGDMLRELSVSSLDVLDATGRKVSLNEDDVINLYVPELDQLKGALYIITNQWREQLATYTNGSDT
jgi:hypothetical protein